MSAILRTEQVEINGRLFTMRLLNVTEGRKVFARLQSLLPFWSSEDIEKGMGPILSGCLSGNVSEADLAALSDAFVPYTTVDIKDGPSPLSKHLNDVFSGSYEDMFTWLDACVKFNFAGIIEKIKGAMLSRAASAETK